MDSQAALRGGNAESDAVAEERRAGPRFPCMIETTCRQITRGGSTSWPARTVDVSAGGIALVLGRRFEPGAVLCVRLESADGEVARELLLRVVHVVADVGGSWRLGCRLAGELEEDELRVLRAQRTRPSEPDCRAWLRFGCDLTTRCHSVAPALPESWSVRVLDVSAGGVSLLTPRQFERGTLLRLELTESSESAEQHLLVRVLRSQVSGAECWILGCEMAEQLADADLERLQ
jgi:hypothetical protein